MPLHNHLHHWNRDCGNTKLGNPGENPYHLWSNEKIKILINTYFVNIVGKKTAMYLVILFFLDPLCKKAFFILIAKCWFFCLFLLDGRVFFFYLISLGLAIDTLFGANNRLLLHRFFFISLDFTRWCYQCKISSSGTNACVINQVYR